MAKKLSPLDDLIIEEIRRREEQEREDEKPSRIYDEEMPIIDEGLENQPEEPKEKDRGVWEWKIWGKGRNN